MSRTRLLFAALLWSLAALPAMAQALQKPGPTPDALAAPPAPRREFRGAWVATVANIDWPSKPGLTTGQQKAELIALLDRAVQLHLNAILFQVRPACDALYASTREPWSEYLTGQMGRAPAPFYDPLAFAVDEAHKRGLELHAWFNPYRARYAGAKSPVSPNHISRTHPEWVKTYGKSLWLDPGETGVQEYSIDVIMDVVRRYDIDGVHIDDYFYPYPERDAAGKPLPFPDDASWQRYQRAGGSRSRDDWRRDNVNQFVARLYKTIKQKKPWVKFGISPFGIYRPGQPAQIKGFDPYAELYADSRCWLQNGWLDYCAPQLYWKIEDTAQSYPVLLSWWVGQNAKGRNLWPGVFTSRVGERPGDYSPVEIEYQIRTTRGIAGATGNIHFSMSALMENRGGIAARLLAGVYAQPALVPASPWLDDRPPGPPVVTARRDAAMQALTLSWEPAQGKDAWLWVVQSRRRHIWATQILPGQQRQLALRMEGGLLPDAVAVSAVDRVGIQSQPAVVLMPLDASLAAR